MAMTKEEAIRHALATEEFVTRAYDLPNPVTDFTARRLRTEWPAVLLFSDSTPYMFFHNEDAAKRASDILNFGDSRGCYRVHYARTKDMSDRAILAALG